MFSKIKNKFHQLFEKYGWKVAVGIFIYYLVRDVALYILLPWYIARNVL
tara:strand:+ start:1053 stop:1199 length:147 start_codon:yes stop_codon:yes gene_type:complete